MRLTEAFESSLDGRTRCKHGTVAPIKFGAIFMAKQWWDEAPLANQETSSAGTWWESAPLADEQPKKKKSRTVGDVAGDVAVTAIKGAVALPQAAVGLADLVSGGRAGKALEEVGYRPGDAQKILESTYSEPQQEANRAVQEADGFVPTLKAAVQNPSTIAVAAGESLPMMLGGAGVARGLLSVAPKLGAVAAGAIGEGVVGAGSAAEQIRQQSSDGLLTPKQSLAAVGSGVGTAALGFAGGKVAQRLGLADVDTMLASGQLGVSKPGFLRQVIGSGISEGAFEELPQSVQEQMWQNFATDRPLTEGVGKAGAMGLLSGAAMGGAGGGFNAVASSMTKGVPPDEVPLPQAVPPEQAGQEAGAPTSSERPQSSAPAMAEARLAELEIIASQRELAPAERVEAEQLIATLEESDVSSGDASTELAQEGGQQTSVDPGSSLDVVRPDAAIDGGSDAGAAGMVPVDRAPASVRGGADQQVTALANEPPNVQDLQQAAAQFGEAGQSEASASGGVDAGMAAESASVPAPGPSALEAAGVADRFPSVAQINGISVGPGGMIQPSVLAQGRPLYRETDIGALEDMLSEDGRAEFRPMFVTDNPDLAIGQGTNKGVRVTFRPDSLSGRENKKPGTGDIAGREYRTDIVAPRAMQSITLPAGDVKRLRGLARRALADFDRRDNPDGTVTFDRKGLSAATQLQESTGASAPVEAISPGSLAQSRPGAANKDFARSVIGRMQAAGQDVEALITDQGELSSAGQQVVQQELQSMAYGDSDPVAALSADARPELRTIGNALSAIAGEWAGMREAVRQGLVPAEVDVTGNLMEAVGMVREAAANQTSLFDMVQQADPITAGLVRMMREGSYLTIPAKPGQTEARLRAYVEAANAAAGDSTQTVQLPPEEVAAAVVQGDFNVQTNATQSQGQPAVSVDTGRGAASPTAKVNDKPSDGATGGGESKPKKPATSAKRQQASPSSEAAQEGDEDPGLKRPTTDNPALTRAAMQPSMTVAAVEDLARSIAAGWENAPEIIVVRDLQDSKVPAAVRAEDAKQRSQDAQGDPEGFYHSGKVYLVASAIEDSAGVQRVLFHEALGHAGLRGVFGKALTPILNDIVIARGPEVRAKAKQYGLDFTNSRQRLAAAEEVLAEMAQTRPELGFVKRAVAAIRTWLRANVPGFSKMKVSDDEIIQHYLIPARGFVERGQKAAAGASDSTRFSRGTNEPMPESKAPGPQGDERSGAKQGNAVTQSRIVSGRGEDLVRLYHGTSEAGYSSIISEGVIRGGSYFGVSGNAVSLSPRRTVAEDFANGGPVIEVQVPKNSLIIDPESNDSADLDEALANGNSVYATGDVYLNEPTAPTSDPGTLADIMSSWDAAGIKNWLSEKDGVIELSRIEVPFAQRNSGVGSIAMRQLLEYADATKQTITLRASRDFGGKKDGLIRFYRRFGFERTGGAAESSSRDTVMTRPPQPNETTAPTYDGVTRFSRSQDTIEVDGIQRPRTNSKGQQIHPTEEGIRNFWRWFGSSKVVDADGRPLVVYHGTGSDFDVFDAGAPTANKWLLGADNKNGFFFDSSPGRRSDSGPWSGAAGYAGVSQRDGETVASAGANIMPVYLALRSPYKMTAAQYRKSGSRPNFKEEVEVLGYDGMQIDDGTFIAFSNEQIKSSTGNTGVFDPNNADIRFSRSTLGNAAPPPIPPAQQTRVQKLKAKALQLANPDTIDNLIYQFQDKFIDLKRVQAHIKALGGVVTDLNDAYLGEELYHKRVAKRTEDFLATELKPLLAEMRANAVKHTELEQYLHARHAPEANKAMAERNPAGEFKGTEAERLSLSGMSDAEAKAIMDGLTPEKRKAMESLAARVDAINAKTMAELEKYGLMDKASLDAWRNAYKFYVPLHRDEAHPDSTSHPIGQGFSVKGDASKRRVGSNQKVTHILGHIAMQREAALTRGEKNNVAKKLYLLASQNPDPNLWAVDKVPKIKTVGDDGTVREMPDPMFKMRPNVVVVRIAGKDAAIVFNERNPQALRMAEAIKNQDATELGWLLTQAAKVTRYFSMINTQLNPIFGIVNFIRDVQGAALNLSSTPLAGKQAQVAKHLFPALRAVYRQERGKGAANEQNAEYIKLWNELQDVGGATGYRALYQTAEDRVNALEAEIKKDDAGAARKVFDATLDWLSDYNEAMENSTRVAVYKVALEQGLSKERAASVAKNITVNFNRKGRMGSQIGAGYAFFNAAVQGTTRLAQTVAGPAGRKIIAGGLAVGMLNTLMGMAVMGAGEGEDDDEWAKIPDFVKERNLIIPIGRQDYVTIPMPLGFHALPNLGRLATELALMPDKTAGKQAGKALGAMLDAFNPLGGGGDPGQTIMPTVLDPAWALATNRDWAGKPIYREDMNNLDPTPGHTRAKESASTVSKTIAAAVNSATGGNEYRPGAVSWTPDQIDYIIGQLTGGIGREIMKAEQTITSTVTGDELPSYKVPLAGRLYGNTRGPANQSAAFYDNARELNEIENEIQGRAKAGEDIGEVMEREPLSKLVGAGNAAERQIAALRKQRRLVIQQGGDDSKAQAEEINAQIGEVMGGLNREVSKIRREAVQ